MKVGDGSCVLLMLDEEIRNGDSGKNIGDGHCRL